MTGNPVRLADLLRREPSRSRAAASGLVSLSTSDTPSVTDELVIVADEARLSKMRRRVMKAAFVHIDGNRRQPKGLRLRAAMVTLTYRPEVEWQPRHLSEALKRFRQWMQRRGYPARYVWCAELQPQRGVIHYHIVTWVPQGRSKRPPMWDQQGWWPHGSSRGDYAHHPASYIAKYASKIGTKDRLPGGARMHGSGGFTAPERAEMKHHGMQGWLRRITYIGQRVRRLPAGLVHLSYRCGLRRAVSSPWVMVSRYAGQVRLTRRDHNQVAAVLLQELARWLPIYSRHAWTQSPKVLPFSSLSTPT